MQRADAVLHAARCAGWRPEVSSARVSPTGRWEPVVAPRWRALAGLEVAGGGHRDGIYRAFYMAMARTRCVLVICGAVKDRMQVRLPVPPVGAAPERLAA